MPPPARRTCRTARRMHAACLPAARAHLVDDLGLGVGGLDGELGELLDGELARVADVHRPHRLVLVHQLDEAVDEVVDEAEGARLLPLAVDGDVLTRDGLHEEVGGDAAVVGVHARPVRVEDARHADVHVVLTVVVEAERLGSALALVVARAHAVAVDVAPVLLDLGRAARGRAGGGAEALVSARERRPVAGRAARGRAREARARMKSARSRAAHVSGSP